MAQRIGSRPDLDALIVSSPVLATDVADPAVEASKAFSGQIDALAEKLPAVTWARAELSAMPDLASIFGIEAAPALLLFRERVGLNAGPATFSPAQFEALVRQRPRAGHG